MKNGPLFILLFLFVSGIFISPSNADEAIPINSEALKASGLNIIQLQAIIFEAKAGNANAQVRIGDYLLNIKPPPDDRAHPVTFSSPNAPQAAFWYKKAAAQGLPEAERKLSGFYAFGAGVPRDQKIAETLMREAAEHGDADAQNTLAYSYERGADVSPDYAEAHYWRDRAAASGNADAKAYNLISIHLPLTEENSLHHEIGDDAWNALVNNDFRAAYDLCPDNARNAHIPQSGPYTLQLLAAAAGNPEAQLSEAEAVEEHMPVTAYVWYTFAARNGISEGAEKAAVLERKMTQEQLSDAKMILAGWRPTAPIFYLSEKPRTRRTTSFNAAVAHTDAKPPVAEVNLVATHGRALPPEECTNVPTDDQYLHKLAEEGDASAQLEVGYKYTAAGNENIPEAMKWIRKSAEKGDDVAQTILGSVYARQAEVGPLGRVHNMEIAHKVDWPQNFSEAASWYRRAADQGNADAQYFLGVLYRDGHGVQQDYQEAIFWTDLAAKNRGDYEKIRNNPLLRNLTKQQMAILYKRLNDWRPQQIVLGGRPQINIDALLCGQEDGFCQAVDECGSIVGIDCNSGGDGPYYFVDKGTREIVGSCSFWQGRCMPPEKWACGRPKNYH